MTVSRETLSEMVHNDVSRETFERLSYFVDLLTDENQRQNLVSKDSISDIWSRHIADSLQLVALAPQARFWLDIGSGAGLPGLVIAIATGAPTLLVEPRRLRTDFIARVVAELRLPQVEIATAKLANVTPRPCDAITARAVASLDKLFDMSLPFSHPGTVWILPKGQSASGELAAARHAWQGRFDTVTSRSDSRAAIVVARDLRRRGK